MVEIQRFEPGISGADQSKARQKMMTMRRTPCVYDGVRYETVISLARKLGVDKSCIHRGIKKGEYRGLKLERVK